MQTPPNHGTPPSPNSLALPSDPRGPVGGSESSSSTRRAFAYPLTPSTSQTYVNAFFSDAQRDDHQHPLSPIDAESQMLAHPHGSSDDHSPGTGGALAFNVVTRQRGSRQSISGALGSSSGASGSQRTSSVENLKHSLGQSFASLGGLLTGGSDAKGKRRKLASDDEHPLAHSHHRAHKTGLGGLLLSKRMWPVLILLALVLCSSFLFHTFFSSSKLDVSPAESSQERLRKLRASLPPARKVPAAEPARKFIWEEGEELAGLVDFLTSEGTHALPAIGESGEVDPALVLDFDPLASASLEDDMADMVEHVWSERTVVLFGKERDSKTRRLREVIADLLIQPSPVLIEVNARADSQHLLPVLSRLLDLKSNGEYPIVLVGGRRFDVEEPYGDEAQLERLKAVITAAGGKFKKPKMKRVIVPQADV